MSDGKIHAPWTGTQVAALNEYQHDQWFHPFTCAYCRESLGTEDDDRLLVATVNGWECPTCDYCQTWAWEGMVSGPTQV